MNKSTYKFYIRFLVFGSISVLLFGLLFSACNKDGVGIYYSISQEEKQINSKISELPVRQVVEAGNFTYALTGRTVWQQEFGSSSWNDIGSGYDIIADHNTSTLYAYDNNDDDSLDEGVIKRFNSATGNWTNVSEFSDKGKLIEIDNNHFAFMLGSQANSSAELYLIEDISNPLAESNRADTYFYAVDGTYLGDTFYLISKSAIYSCQESSVTTVNSISPSFSGTESDFDIDSEGLVAITNDHTNLFLITAGGKVFSSTNGSDWELIDSVSDTPYEDSVMVFGDFLIFGTNDGYYELNLTADEPVIAGPTETADTDDPESFAAAYPDLSPSLVFDVFVSPTQEGVFYLATENGLWKRTAAGQFNRL